MPTRNHGFAVLHQLDGLAWEWFGGGDGKDIDEALNTECVIHIFDGHSRGVADVYACPPSLPVAAKPTNYLPSSMG